MLVRRPLGSILVRRPLDCGAKTVRPDCVRRRLLVASASLAFPRVLHRRRDSSCGLGKLERDRLQRGACCCWLDVGATTARLNSGAKIARLWCEDRPARLCTTAASRGVCVASFPTCCIGGATRRVVWASSSAIVCYAARVCFATLLARRVRRSCMRAYKSSGVLCAWLLPPHSSCMMRAALLTC